MDKKLILAVAGAGKTTFLINKLNKEKKFLIITYTINNYNDIKNSVIKRFNEIPSNIKIYTYFDFLYNFCFKPFETMWNSKGLYFNKINNNFYSSKQKAYYIEINSKKIYASRLSKFCTDNLFEKISNRLEKYFDFFFVDEIQDFASNDFNFIKKLIKINLNILYVGDFYQHTFDTSRDGNTNCNLHNNYNDYLKKFKKDNKDLIIDNTILLKSKRCSKSVCEFVTSKLEIEIKSYEENLSEVRELINAKEIINVVEDDKIIKLFYQNSKKYICNSDNWGNSKGTTYLDVCVVLNSKTYNFYRSGKLNELPSSTKNKLYVACTRTKNNLFFIDEKILESYKKSNNCDRIY